MSNNRPIDELKKEYKDISKIGVYILIILKELKKEQKRLFDQNIKDGLDKEGKYTGGAGKMKTIFINDGLIPHLKRLIKISKDRSTHVTKLAIIEKRDQSRKKDETEKGYKRVSKKDRTLTKELEKGLLVRLNKLLDDVNSVICSLDELQKEKLTKQGLLEKINNMLREVDKISKEFFKEREDIRKTLGVVEKKIEINIGDTLTKKIYDHPTEYGCYDFGNKHESVIKIFTLKEAQLKLLAKEAIIINQQKIPFFEVKFRQWWRVIPLVEIDATIGFGPLGTDPKKFKPEPHVNAEINLGGRRSKKFHLLIAA